jgi:hypothetical protein
MRNRRRTASSFMRYRWYQGIEALETRLETFESTSIEFAERRFGFAFADQGAGLFGQVLGEVLAETGQAWSSARGAQ